MDRNIRRDPSAGTHVVCAKKGAPQQQWQSVPLPEGFQYRHLMREPSIDTLSSASTEEFV